MTRRLPHLADGTVVLRPWKVDDAPALMAACREPDIAGWSGLPSPYTFGHAVTWIGDAIFSLLPSDSRPGQLRQE